MSGLTDQQLRQELSKFGESVPPITTRNREQLRARLELLRSAKPKGRTSVAASPTRTRNRSVGSPRRTAQPTTPSRIPTRSKGAAPAATTTPKKLIELSDSEVESPRTIQTRSRGEISVTEDVEQSIARHRREIQQLINTARDRTKAASPTRSGSGSAPEREPSPKKEKKKIELRPKSLAKIFFISFLFITGVTLAALKGAEYFSSSPSEDSQPAIDAIAKQLKIRKGEVECGFRNESETFVTREEIEEHLQRKGFALDGQAPFESIIEKVLKNSKGKIRGIDKDGRETNTTGQIVKFASEEAVHSLLCRVQKDVHKTLRNLAFLVLGSTGLLTLAWFLSRRSKEHDDEQTFKVIVEEAICLLRDQYEEHIRNPLKEPWLTMNHIREKLIPEKDQERLKTMWERVKKHLSEQESRVKMMSQKIRGEDFDVWQWIKSAVTPKKTHEEPAPVEEGLTECLKLRNFFSPTKEADDREIDQVVDSIQNRCTNIKRIEHIGIHSVFVYLKFSSKEAAAQGYHQLNNWKYHGREINAKYVRLTRYHEHFPEADETKKKTTKKN